MKEFFIEFENYLSLHLFKFIQKIVHILGLSKNEIKGIIFIHQNTPLFSRNRNKYQLKFFLNCQLHGVKSFTLFSKMSLPKFFDTIKLGFLTAKFQCIVVFNDFQLDSRFPSKNILSHLFSKYTTAAIWHETFNIAFAGKKIERASNYIHLNIVVDDPEFDALKSSNLYELDRVFFPFPLFPSSEFKEFKNDRKNHLVFFGSTENNKERGNRNRYLKFLADNGFEVYGAQYSSSESRKTRLDYRKMLQGLANSKFGLAFSNHGTDGIITGRIPEIISQGAVLISENNRKLKVILDENTDYLSFNNEQELLSQIKKYFLDLEFSKKLSMNAQQKFLNQYTVEKFLDYIVDYASKRKVI